MLLFRSSPPMCASFPRSHGDAFCVCDARSSLGRSRRPGLRRSSSLFSKSSSPVRRETQRATTNWDMRGAFRAGAMATVPCTGGRCLADTRVVLEPWMPFVFPVSHGRSQVSKVCLSSASVQGGGQNARLFAIGTRSEVDLVGAFWSTLTTVPGKTPQGTF